MNEPLRELCDQFLAGEIPENRLVQRCLQLALCATEEAQIDLQRRDRCGFPEVVYGEGKSIATLVQIVETLHERGQPVLVTRLSSEARETLAERFPSAICHELARTFRLEVLPASPAPTTGRVAVITAGTSDLPVAVEAQETLRWMQVEVIIVNDVGVAGPHRLPAHLDRLCDLDAAVVVAGMEGALPSVVGGYLNCPVIAVPTSVGYGASFHGVAALLGMLNSCAANVAVVNIDAGFKGGYLAGLIAHQRHRTPESRWRVDACADANPAEGKDRW